ncbi:MAG: Fic family protein [Candidatus Sumerlaeia bacterium]|nr:Fic family protein [Candidatus Sumerlaeia bacterium]
MMTLRQFAEHPPESLPTVTAFMLGELGEARGRQDLHTKQAPQKLMKLRESATIESAISSNRIEGVEVEHSRVGTLMHGNTSFRDRDEAEVSGYRDALRLVHEGGASLPIAESTILRLHAAYRGYIWDAGVYKEKDADIIEKHPDGRSRIRFRTVPADKTPAAMTELFDLWQQGFRERKMPPLVLAGALNLDFLCIHPFRDGNGRASRLLLLQSLYHCGLEVGRYISIERLVEQHKDRYYETLEISSRNWLEGAHNPWPYINFLLFIANRAYKELEERMGQVAAPRGEKSAAIEAAIERRTNPFRVSDIQADCPTVSVDLIRRVLKGLKGSKVECLGRGPRALWRRIN